MNLAYLFLLIPGFLVIRTILILSTWLRNGFAGLPGFVYERQAEPSWYWLSVICGLLLLVTYIVLGAFLFMAIKAPDFNWSSPINLLIGVLLISQESGLKLRNQPPSA